MPDKIISRLYLSDVKAAKKYSNIKKNNIELIINITTKYDNYHKDMGIHYVNIKIKDKSKTKYFYKKNLDKLLKIMKEYIDKDKNVLVHCEMGISRSSSVIVAYLMKYEKKNYDDAVKHVKKRRKKIRPHPLFKEQLLKFENELTRSNSTDNSSTEVSYYSTS